MRTRWLFTVLTLGTLSGCANSADGDDEIAATDTDSNSESETESGTSESDESESETESETSESDESESETDETGGEFVLTSPAFDRGAAIPIQHSCYGANVSPQLEWDNPPANTMSFAVFFADLSINFNHSAIFDIPGDQSGLPADVDKTAMPQDVPGATQPRSYANNFGYAGPCPGNPHTYQFTLYAIDVETIADIDQDSSLAQVKAALIAHSLAEVTLSGEFTPP